ncbi:uncharacterized protein [Ptychodera flava]|uniref:uncharacterized protein n=1 Tax=Ptychodera flava TaxID=63121 RepID=UPI003969D9F7
MPESFSNFSDCRVVIDCTEIFTERASSLDAQKQTWSNYKHRNTLKFLIGIVPGGGISYISKAWGGRASDKVITRQCGLLEDLDSGDGVMADRGFDIAADLTPLGVKLYMPAFKGSHRDQLTANEVVSTKRLAEVRIHVERAIGRLKQFHILDDVVPVTMKDTAEQIVTVCGYLTNFMPPLC